MFIKRCTTKGCLNTVSHNVFGVYKNAYGACDECHSKAGDILDIMTELFQAAAGEGVCVTTDMANAYVEARKTMNTERAINFIGIPT